MSFHKQILFLCLAASLVSGCSTTQKHVNLETNATSKPEASAPEPSISVQKTVYSILLNHKQIKAAQAARETAEYNLSQARAGYGPSVSLQGALGGSVVNSSTTRNKGREHDMEETVEASARIVQPIFDGFATRSKTRIAEANLENAKDRLMDTANSLAFDGIVAQIDINMRRAIYSFAEASVSKHEQILEQIKSRFAMGAETKSEESQTLSRLMNARNTLAEAKAALIVAENRYARLTNLPVSVDMGAVQGPPIKWETSEEVVNQARRWNPMLRAYMNAIKAAQGEVELVKATFFPTLNIEAGPAYSRRGQGYGKNDDWEYSFEAMATLRWNVLNGGADKAEMKSNLARVRQARQAMLGYSADLKLSIDTAWADLKAAVERKRRFDEAVVSADDARKVYQEQFLNGQRSLLDVLNIETEYYNSQMQAEMAGAEMLTCAYRLCALTGTLLPLLNIELPAILDVAPRTMPADVDERPADY